VSDAYSDWMYRQSEAGQRDEAEKAARRRKKIQDVDLIKGSLVQLERERALSLTIRGVEEIDREIHQLKALLKDRS